MPARWSTTTTALLVGGALALGAAGTALGDEALRLAKGSVGTAELRNGAVTNEKVKKGSLLRSAFKPGQVPRANLAGIKARGALDGTYPAPDLADGAVRAAKLATASVGARAIAGNAVGRSEIATAAVGSDELAPGAVRTSDIANGAVAASKIAEGAVGASQIGANAVGRSELKSGAVGPNELGALPGASVYRAADYTVPPNAVTVIPLTDVAYDQGGVFQASQRDRLLAPRRGIYLASASVGFRNTTLGTRTLWITPAGDAGSPWVGENAPVTSDAAGTLISVAVPLLLEAGQGVSLVVRQTGSDPIQVLGSGRQTGLTLQFISPA
jgi:hypothetical protein